MSTLRYAWRSLMKAPSFTSVAVLTLGIGIGAATCIFSVIDAVLLARLPYPHPERLVRVWEQAPDGHRMNLADPNFDDFHDQNDTFITLAVSSGNVDVSMSGGSEPIRTEIAIVSRDFFRTFGVRPAIGRGFAPEELREHGAAAIIVSYGYWKRYLGESTNLSRVHVSLAGEVFPVIGVMPPDFDYPTGVAVAGSGVAI